MPFVRVFLLGTLWVGFETQRSVAQPYNGWVGSMPPPFVQGSTLAGTMRNAAQAVSTQCNITRQAAANMGQRAQSPMNWQQYFVTDYQNLQFQFNALRYTFGQLNQLVPQLKRPRATNAAAELEAGLNIIAEAFEPVQQEWQAGSVNPDTVIRMCQVLDEALGVWNSELKKDASRLGMLR